jgi:NAD(P)-dependent dehydrogenase (short-subunit alcohol dehydrogenase family)
MRSCEETDLSRVMLVTGGGRGIGAATCRLAAEQGYRLCVNYLRNRDAADKVVRDISSRGGKAIAVGANVADEADVLRLFQTVDRELGRIDALINNAGILARASRLQDIDLARIEKLYATNVFGAMLCAREAVKRMSTRNRGSGGAIVNVSTGFVKSGAPGMFVDYASSKAAIEAFTGGLAREVATEGIRVNAVRPGMIDTEIHAEGGDPDRMKKAKDVVPMKRAGEAEEVARAILWLASDAASYTTGTVLDVSGGI